MLCFVSYTIYTIWPVRSRSHCTVSIMNHMGVTPASDLAIGSVPQRKVWIWGSFRASHWVIGKSLVEVLGVKPLEAPGFRYENRPKCICLSNVLLVCLPFLAFHYPWFLRSNLGIFWT